MSGMETQWPCAVDESTCDSNCLTILLSSSSGQSARAGPRRSIGFPPRDGKRGDRCHTSNSRHTYRATYPISTSSWSIPGIFASTLALLHASACACTSGHFDWNSRDRTRFSYRDLAAGWFVSGKKSWQFLYIRQIYIFRDASTSKNAKFSFLCIFCPRHLFLQIRNDECCDVRRAKLQATQSAFSHTRNVFNKVLKSRLRFFWRSRSSSILLKRRN